MPKTLMPKTQSSAGELDELLAQHGADEDWAAAVRAAMHQQRRG